MHHQYECVFLVKSLLKDIIRLGARQRFSVAPAAERKKTSENLFLSLLFHWHAHRKGATMPLSVNSGDFDDRSPAEAEGPSTPSHEYGRDSNEAGSGSSVKTDEEDCINLYIRGIPRELADNSQLEDAIRPYAHVISCSVVFEPYSKECRGFGFVKVATKADAEAAMNPDNDISLMGSTIRIERARRNGPHVKTPGQYLGVDRSGIRKRPYEGHGYGCGRGGSSGRGGFTGGSRGGYGGGYGGGYRGGYGGGYGGYGREFDRGPQGYDRHRYPPHSRGPSGYRGGHGARGGYGHPRSGDYGRGMRDSRGGCDFRDKRNGGEAFGHGEERRGYHADGRYHDERNQENANKRQRVGESKVQASCRPGDYERDRS